MAAKQGYVEAHVALGASFAEGANAPKSTVKAYVCYSLAQALGHENLESRLRIIKEQMNSTEIGWAQRLAKEWWEEYHK